MKKTINTDPSTKVDRKTIERNRRIHMKALCFKLASLIPPHYLKHTKEMISQQDQLDMAASYIRNLRDKLEKLKGKKEEAMRWKETKSNNGHNEMLRADQNVLVGSNLPLLELRDLGSSIEVMLISGLNKTFMLYELITVVEEEGAEVVSASFSTVGDKIFHTIHAQVKISRVGVETSRVYQRLYDLITPFQSLEYF
ncbi:transcription factor bHLH162-like [Senna tora]|uniref:Transcription factor bHLH162-like n=1 Tax=Senna tora TaxID=362788 RepID=A0A834X4R1_9FABA|nr:transcription factor bHLH162-like [Senna tora]